MKGYKDNPEVSGEFLDKSEEHLRHIQRLAHIGSWMLNLKTGIVHASEEGCRIYGLEKRGYPFTEIQDMTLPEYREKLDASLKKLYTGIEDYDEEYRIRRASDGEILYLHSMAECDAEQQIVIGTIHDITERKRAEEALQESEARFRTLFDNSVSGIVYSDAEGIVLEANRAMLQFLGSPSVEETKKINLLTFPPLVQVGFSPDLEKSIRTRGIVFGDARYTSKWGTVRYLEYVLNPVVRDDKIAGIIAKVEDITERKAAEEKIHSLLEEKDMLMREIHHRLKNNLAVIESLLRMQVNGTKDQNVQAPLIDALGRLSSMRVLYDKLHRSATVIEVDIEEYLSTLAEEICGVFPETEDIEIVRDIDNFPLPSKKIFSLGLIVNELLTNIMKYAFPGSVENKHIILSASRQGGRIRIVVRDNGIGFNPGTRATTSSGFGLQLIRMLTEQMEGTVVFENDNGTVCTLDLPEE